VVGRPRRRGSRNGRSWRDHRPGHDRPVSSDGNESPLAHPYAPLSGPLGDTGPRPWGPARRRCYFRWRFRQLRTKPMVTATTRTPSLSAGAHSAPGANEQWLDVPEWAAMGRPWRRSPIGRRPSRKPNVLWDRCWSAGSPEQCRSVRPVRSRFPKGSHLRSEARTASGSGASARDPRADGCTAPVRDDIEWIGPEAERPGSCRRHLRRIPRRGRRAVDT
jgi:hypothetical protein